MDTFVRDASRIGLKPAVVRPFDIRGHYGVDLDESDAHFLGLSYATLSVSEGRRRIAVGRDGRLSSTTMETALISGLVEGGVEVYRVGLGPTPQVAFAVRHLGLDGGVMVTASHNPPEDNGFKLFLGDRRLHGDALQALASRSGEQSEGGQIIDADISDAYIGELAAIGRDIRPFNVAWDCGSGATGQMLTSLVPMLPGRHLLINAEVDGRFPAHHADPADAKNLRELQAQVVEGRFDIGIAFDGDGDRIGVVDSSGSILLSDHLLLYLANDLLRYTPGSKVVADVKCSRILFDGVGLRGGEAIVAPSGYVPVRDKMREVGAKLGGELSGHIFYADSWDGTDDALYVAMRLLQALSRCGESLLDFRASLPKLVSTPEYRIPCPDNRKDAVVSEVAERIKFMDAVVDYSDGIRVENADGWWLLRASNTEPRITCRCEASDDDGLARLMDTLRRQLRMSGVHEF